MYGGQLTWYQNWAQQINLNRVIGLKILGLGNLHSLLSQNFCGAAADNRVASPHWPEPCAVVVGGVASFSYYTTGVRLLAASRLKPLMVLDMTLIILLSYLHVFKTYTNASDFHFIILNYSSLIILVHKYI